MKGRRTMKIKRVYKKTSLKFGRVEMVDEAKAREVFGQTEIAFHYADRCGKEGCQYCSEPSMKKLLKGDVISTFFSDFQLIEA